MARAAATAFVVGSVVAGTIGSGSAGAATHTDSATAPFVFAHPATNPALVTAGRVFAAAAGDSSGQRGVLYGGEKPGSSSAYGDTWVNEPDGTWRPMCGTAVAGATAPCGPGTRAAPGMADAPGGVVLFGGLPNGLDGGGGNPPDGDTWRWNGSTWSAVCNAATCGPSPRALMAMAGNGASAVMFGGLGQSGSLGDTWVFSGNTWKQACGQTAVPCGPGVLVGASMAWDGRHFVLFGGEDLNGDNAPVDDTWTFGGTRWTKVCGTSMGKPCGPDARTLAAFAFVRSADPSVQGALLAEGGDLFGNGTQHLDRDAWLFDGARWSALDPPWNGSAVSWSDNNGSPPAGPDPLIGVMAAKPALCEVVYLGTAVTTAANPPTLELQTYIAGRSLWNRTEPGCQRSATGPALPRVPSPIAAPGAAPAAPTRVAPAAAVPTLANTGPGAVGLLGVLGLVLVAFGTFIIRFSRSPRLL